MDNGRFYMGTHFMMEDEMIMTISLFVARKIVMIVTPKLVYLSIVKHCIKTYSRRNKCWREIE